MELLCKKVIGGRELRPFQANAIQVLESGGCHLAVDAAPGLGKSLVAVAALWEAHRRGLRGAWIVPLKALVQEKTTWLKEQVVPALKWQCTVLSPVGGDAPPLILGPDVVLVTTYEWFVHNVAHHSLGALVIDEAQELHDPQRGPGLLRLAMFQRYSKHTPRFTILGHSLTRSWEMILPELTTICSDQPANIHLHFRPESSSFQKVIMLITEIFQDNPMANVAVFVAQVRYTQSLAQKLGEALKKKFPVLVERTEDQPLARAFNASLAEKERIKIVGLIQAGRLPVVVTTTALAKGVDLPLDVVIIRDVKLPGRPPLTMSEVRQLGGRCGRRTTPGVVYVLRARPKKEQRVPISEEERILAAILVSLYHQKSTFQELIKSVGGEQGRGATQWVANCLSRLRRCGTVTRNGPDVAISGVGRVVAESPLPLERTLHWAAFFQDLGDLQLTMFDTMILYAAVMNIPPHGGGSVMGHYPSNLWDRWLVHDHWDPLFASLDLPPVRKTKAKKRGEYVMRMAATLMEEYNDYGHLPRGFATLELLSTRGRVRTGEDHAIKM